MAFNVKDPETDRLAREERLAREQRKKSGKRLADELMEIAEEAAKLPILDTRSEDEILGYGPDGNPD